MKKIFYLNFLFLAIICPSVLSMECMNLLEYSDDFSDGEYSGLEELIENISSEEEIIIKQILELEKKRQEEEELLGKRIIRKSAEINLIIKLYEIILEENDWDIKTFFAYLKSVGVSISHRMLDRYLLDCRCLKQNERQLAFVAKVIDLLESYKYIVEEILHLKNQRQKDRTKEERGLIIRLWEFATNKIGKKTKIEFFMVKIFCDCLCKEGFDADFDSIYWTLTSFRGLSEKEKKERRYFIDRYIDSLGGISSIEKSIIDEIVKIERGIVDNKVKKRIGQNIINGFFVMLYEIFNGKITVDIKLDTKMFIRRLSKIGYLEDKDIKKISVRLSGAFARFKKLPEEKKEKKRAKVDKYLKKIRE